MVSWRRSSHWPVGVLRSFHLPNWLESRGSAVWRRYRQKRELRRLRGSSSPLPEEVLDRLDRLEAEQECRERRYVGKPIS